MGNAVGQHVGYDYDLLGNRSQLVYPDGRVVTTTYDMDNRLVQVEDWHGGLTTYVYDGIGRLITTTLPNQVIAQNSYNAAHHLTQLRYTGPGETLLAEFQYQVDGLGQRQVVTETLLSPAYEEVIEAFVAAGGLLVLEAENGLVTPGLNSQTWVSQTSQSGYAGESYLRALPDTGQRYEGDELDDSPRLTYPIYAPETADYTIWIRGMAADSAGDSLHLGLNGQAVANTTRLTGFDNQDWQWQSLTMSNTQPVLSLEAGADSLNIWMREDGLRIDRLLLITDTNYIPTGSGPTASSLQLVTHTVAAQPSSHVIHYTYDNLHRLTQATYSGDINAEYNYAYDPVGNMTAYTETVGSETTRVTRTFDDANRLQTAFDFDQGATSYLYDNNGNLTLLIPPGGGSWLHYEYDQRNLMISHTLSISGTSPQLQAAYSYDGSSNRAQQVDDTGTTPITTTYTNDIMGLAQALVADNGSSQTHMLYGLDLISQDDSNATRYLLADGLGSVRVELVDDTIETTTTYAPFGSLLQQTGSSGTVYGFTGEQYDTSTNQLYLRARYYNPGLHTLMGKDPWNGNPASPQSMNGWSYVENNPINLTDLTGMSPWFRAAHCMTVDTSREYAECVRGEYGVDPPDEGVDMIFEFKGEANCWFGEVPYRARGYVEGWSSVPIALFLGLTVGMEVVYDFATMERTNFNYAGGVLQDSVGGSYSEYLGDVYGFRSWGWPNDHSVIEDYKGWFQFFSGGISAGLIAGAEIGPGIGVGGIAFQGVADPSVYGEAYYLMLAFSLDPVPILDFGTGFTYYHPDNFDYKNYRKETEGDDRVSVEVEQMMADMLGGTGSVGFSTFANGPISQGLRRKFIGGIAHRYIYYFTQIHYESYPDD